MSHDRAMQVNQHRTFLQPQGLDHGHGSDLGDLDRADGTITGVKHNKVIEERAHELGKKLRREIQERKMGKMVKGRMDTEN